MSREFNEIDKYRQSLVGKKIESIHLNTGCDEGLILVCEDDTVLCFGFSGNEGLLSVHAATDRIKDILNCSFKT